MTTAQLLLLAHAAADGTVELCAPRPGLARELPAAGAVLVAGQRAGALEVLGVVRPLIVPPSASGRVVERLADPSARAPVGYGAVLLRLDPSAASAGAPATSPAASASTEGYAFRSPMSGRVYTRPAPDKPPFVAVGDVIAGGQVVCLLEVMKTFNRVAFGGEGLPERARVVRWCVEDGADVTSGEALFAFEPEGP
jgi:acetyl-CoA carboxylase biotin carboxyl carrier protein